MCVRFANCEAAAPMIVSEKLMGAEAHWLMLLSGLLGHRK